MKLLDKGVNVNSYLASDGSKFNATVSVDDAQVREKAPGFDGHERVFVMLPAEKDGQVEWTRHYLKYEYSWDYTHSMAADPNAAGVYNVHTANLNSGSTDAAAIMKHGIAFGMDTNIGTLWLQTQDDNFRPASK